MNNDTLHKKHRQALAIINIEFCEKIRIPMCWDSYYIWSNCDGLILGILPKISVQITRSYTVTLLEIWFLSFSI